MQQPQVHSFLERFFQANDSDLIENERSYLTVQLSIDLDKRLMNRPFYWHYLEKTGGAPQPMQVTFITDPANAPDHLKGEPVYFGSPRLRQIFTATRELGGFIRLYEQTALQSQKSNPLHPWLCLNTKISFQCDRKKDVFLSLGLNLIHGQIVPNFFEQLQQKTLTPTIPDYCFTLTPLIKPKSGLVRIQKMVQTFIDNEDDTWAREALERWDKDLALLEAFYEDYIEKPEAYEIERKALEEQYKPTVNISIINGGMFYLNQQVF
ncbi:YqhG family protein [Halalkalibacter sp. APA_J-10(15)]|uniref:YqhG family protein n=1 Tax=Halalkalibacter sp. APA_J-10(15) TaxID=2933805 RepID=UPI001FF63496|nr:YqhG family protein [Halalkalibacter sp. APA_J-10(15)]MCK0472582.1 YqhG family protein [Halalkalibacter sp. APA_J-10(15)]